MNGWLKKLTPHKLFGPWEMPWVTTPSLRMSPVTGWFGKTGRWETIQVRVVPKKKRNFSVRKVAKDF